MLQIGETLISLDIIEELFVCDITHCMGSCCVHGDSGAPLEKHEARILKKEFDEIVPFLTKEGVRAISAIGTSTIDKDGDLVTPLINNKECAYTIFRDGIAACGIELAWEDKKCTLQKPVSCHLYPIRLKKYPTFMAVNYDKWEICKPAKLFGKSKSVPLYEFLKIPLIRKFGDDWYAELVQAAQSLSDDEHSD